MKTIPPRGKRQNINYPLVHEELNDLNNINLTLNKTTLKFHNGTWLQLDQQGRSNGAPDENSSIVKQKLRQMEEENNLNQLKIDLLLDMLTENLSELNVLKNPQ